MTRETARAVRALAEVAARQQHQLTSTFCPYGTLGNGTARKRA